jgi:hypothetical protein
MPRRDVVDGLQEREEGDVEILVELPGWAGSALVPWSAQPGEVRRAVRTLLRDADLATSEEPLAGTRPHPLGA